jgi:filamentous hemagglutinin
LRENWLRQAAEFFVAPRSGKSLLAGEGAVGTYDDLIAAGAKGDNITPHHIPSANHMKQHGVAKGDGISINMEHPHPGSGGRHRQTFTYGMDADVGLSPRDALGRGVRDARRIYQEDGLYDPFIRQRLQELIQQNKQAYPELFLKKPGG